MSKAAHRHTTIRRRPEDAATLGLMLLKASIRGLDGNAEPALPAPRKPVLAGGSAVRALELA